MAGLPITDGEHTAPPLVPRLDGESDSEPPDDGETATLQLYDEPRDDDQARYHAGIVSPVSSVSF